MAAECWAFRVATVVKILYSPEKGYMSRHIILGGFENFNYKSCFGVEGVLKAPRECYAGWRIFWGLVWKQGSIPGESAHTNNF